MQVVFSGNWILVVVGCELVEFDVELVVFVCCDGVSWDCVGIEVLDSVGVVLLWCVWGCKLFESVIFKFEQQCVFEWLVEVDCCVFLVEVVGGCLVWICKLGGCVIDLQVYLIDFIVLMGQVVLDLVYLCCYLVELFKCEISVNFFKVGVCVMLVMVLVGCLIGIVLFYLFLL